MKRMLIDGVRVNRIQKRHTEGNVLNTPLPGLLYQHSSFNTPPSTLLLQHSSIKKFFIFYWHFKYFLQMPYVQIEIFSFSKTENNKHVNIYRRFFYSEGEISFVTCRCKHSSRSRLEKALITNNKQVMLAHMKSCEFKQRLLVY